MLKFRLDPKLAAACAAILLVSACNKPAPPPATPDSKLPSVKDLELPKADAPIVDAASYDQGYDVGMDAGELAAHRKPPRSKIPTEEESTVIALEAAGADSTRAERWQRGYASGYREGFTRITTGRK